MWRKRFNSFRFAFAGIASLFRTEPNARIHSAVALGVIAAGIFFSLTIAEWCLIVLAIAFVFSAEAMNTALENLTNLVSPEYNPLAGKAKDMAAGAVLIAAIGAAAVGVFIFLPKIFRLLQ